MIDYEGKSWIRVLLRVRGTVLTALIPRVLVATSMGAFAHYVHSAHRFRVPPTVHTMLGVALGLLLVFRTNASYDRWWEGRKLFGGMVNRLRDLARQTATWLPEGATRAEAQRLLILWYRLLVQHLRGERDLAATGVDMTDGEKKALEAIGTRPVLVSRWFGELVAREAAAGHLTETRLFAIDQNITALNDFEGGCERILRTPIPFAYAHHIKGFLALFVFTAPFALADVMGAMTPVAAFFVAYGMFGIEEIGVEIEDPFGYDPNDLPLDRIGTTIANDTKMLSVEPTAPLLRASSPAERA